MSLSIVHAIALSPLCMIFGPVNCCWLSISILVQDIAFNMFTGFGSKILYMYCILEYCIWLRMLLLALLCRMLNRIQALAQISVLGQKCHRLMLLSLDINFEISLWYGILLKIQVLAQYVFERGFGLEHQFGSECWLILFFISMHRLKLSIFPAAKNTIYGCKCCFWLSCLLRVLSLVQLSNFSCLNMLPLAPIV